MSHKLEPDHRLSSEVYRNWGEMTTGQLNFDRRRGEVEALKKVQVQDLLRFFDRSVVGVAGAVKAASIGVNPSSCFLPVPPLSGTNMVFVQL